VNVYVAGAWIEQETRARPWIAKLRAAGIHITHDWTVAEARPGVTSDAELTPEERRAFAKADFDGVRNADVVWLLAPNEKGACGAWVELGIALGSGIGIIYVSGLKAKRSIFTELAMLACSTDEEAFQHITQLIAYYKGSSQ
jgi:Nucleoside 2-deoxyribosyltransferase